jgi:hypothetical protein
MPTRGRKYTNAAPEPVVEALDEQRRADGDQTATEKARERATWRADQIERASRNMLATGDAYEMAVGEWLRTAWLAARSARMRPGEELLPEGQFDHAGRIASAWLRTRGG